jgi:putative phosphoesterase
MRIGVIADTHGWLDPRALDAFAGVDAILHAGDIGALAVVAALGAIAPVHVVRGNNDTTPDLLALPEYLDLELAGHRVHLVHRPQDARPGAAAIVIYGHTHKVTVEQRDGV